MNDQMKGFCIQKGYRGREVNAVLDGASRLGVEVCWSQEALDGWVSVGAVEWCAPAFGEHRIDFFPEFLTWYRAGSRVWTSRGQLYAPRFVKDGTAWKSEWESKVYPTGTILNGGPYWVIEPVIFVQEWRYYVANGRVVTTGWYAGDDEDEPAPELDIEWPSNFSGAVDFGRLDDGRIALVEAHAPFACGWYGERHQDYAEWMLESWKSRDWWLTELGGFERLCSAR